MPKGFWSYVRDDDNTEGGRIVKLAQDLVEQYEMITGEEIELFIDRDDLEWGDNWQSKIDSGLASGVFFIPVLTPRFFQSSECRRELNYFVRQAKELGVQELIMPILYVDIPALHEEKPSDEAIALIKSFQWEDWCTLRLNSSKSPSYRRAVFRMAGRLADANEVADKTDIATRLKSFDKKSLDSEADKPGFIDLVARMEETIPKWTSTIEDITKDIESISPIMDNGTIQLQTNDRGGGGLSGRLKILKGIAKQLTPLSVHIEELGQQYTSQLHDVDNGIRLFIEHLPKEVKAGTASSDEVQVFFQSIRSLANSSNESLNSLDGMLDAMSPLEGMSRDLRKPLRSVRKGLTSMVEGQEIINEWIELIDRLPPEDPPEALNPKKPKKKK